MKYLLLHKCIKYYNIDSFFYFLEHGHSLNEADQYGNTCLHYACRIGHFPFVQYLIEQKRASIEAKNKEQATPLHDAILSGLPFVKYLIEKGANIKTTDNYERTPLHIAACCGNTEVVRYLLSKGASKYAVDKSRKTPYDSACEFMSSDKSQREAIKQLLKCVIDPTKKSCIIG